ncbi:NAD(P)H-binding protein [Flaviaesturariibacter amylovorans]|uniref:Oxidoreductase n=1 Tax=Flaviaesturariibacter amylovorans TaxID=1084520 RepID=A0ABP8GP52_9BACT
MTTTLIGATGLIGGHLLEALRADPAFGTIRVLLRRPVPFDGPRTELRMVDFNDAAAYRNAIAGSDLIFCAVGTTQQKVGGDKEAYRRIDFDIPVNAARLGRETGCRHLLLVSSVGADASSSNFYLRLKGETEDAVRAAGLPATSIFRPSMLLGNRREVRVGERIGQVLMKTFSFALAGGLRKYKPIEAADVARAMVAKAKADARGNEVLEYDAMFELRKSRQTSL